MTPKITGVEATRDYKLHVRFKGHRPRLFNVRPYLSKGIFKELRETAYFKKVRIVWGGVEWPHEQDLSAETLYCLGSPLQKESYQEK